MAIVGTIWHSFTPDFDGIYIFAANRDGGGTYQYSVWEGPTLSTITPVPGYMLQNETNYRTLNPRVLRKDVTYWVRVERQTGETWGTYSLDVTAYPDYEDWESVTAGYDSITGAASYSTDTLTATGAVGYASVDPWRDLADDPQNAGLRWISVRFKMRITSGQVISRDGFYNRLGVLRFRDSDDNDLGGLAVWGNGDGTNALGIYRDGAGPFGEPVMGAFCHLGTDGRTFNEWIDVELNLSPGFGSAPSYLPEFAVNGVIKRSRFTDPHGFYTGAFQIYGSPRSVDVGMFAYPDGYSIDDANEIGQEAPDEWELEIKDVYIRNRPTLGSIPPTDTADQGITHFDGFEHGVKLENVFQNSGNPSAIIDAPGTPPGNADWWKAVNVSGSGVGSDYLYGGVYHTWMGQPRPWAGFWLFIEEFPDIGTGGMMSIAQFAPTGTSGFSNSAYTAVGTLTLTNTGELRVIPILTDRWWWSECVGRLEEGSWYWIEMEVDASVPWDTTVQISINGFPMGTFGGGRTTAQLQSMIFSTFNPQNYQRFPTALNIAYFEAGVTKFFSTFYSSNFWQTMSPANISADVSYAHVCAGRAVPYPQGALQTKLFEGHDGDGTHNFPELPAEHVHLETDLTDNIWTLYDYILQNDPDPTVAAPNFFYYQHPNPPQGTVGIVSDGSGPAEISGYANAVEWTARTPVGYDPFGNEHYPGFGFSPREFYTTAGGGWSSDMYVALAWVKGPGSLDFKHVTHPGGGPEYNGYDAPLTGSYLQSWMAAFPAWITFQESASSWVGMRWYATADADKMYWKRPMMVTNPLVYPRFALSSDAGATWTMLDDPAVSNTSDNIGQDVAASSNTAVWMNNTSALKRLLELRQKLNFFGGAPMAVPGYQMTDWYLEYLNPPSPVIEEAEEFGGTRGYNLHLRHGGYQYQPTTDRTDGDLFVTLWDGTHRAPHHVVTRSASGISRVRYPTDPSGGHWTTSEFEDTVMRFGYYRQFGSGGGGLTYMSSGSTAYHSTQFRGAYLEALQWEVLSQAAPGPRPGPCRRPQIYRLVTYQGRN